MNIKQINSAFILLSETHLTEAIDNNEMTISNYNLYRADSNSRHTGGAAVYVRDDIVVLNVEKIVVNSNMWLIAVKVNTKIFRGTVACVYRSPNCESNDTFFTEIDNWLRSKAESNESIILCGDVNIDWLSNNNVRNRMFQCINDNGFKQCVDNYTRICEETKTLIDYCIVNITNDLKVNTNSDLKISDHEAITCEIKKNKKREENEMKEIQFLYKYNSFDLNTKLLKSNWFLAQNQSLSEKCCYFVEHLKKAVNTFVRTKNIKSTNKCNWYCNYLKNLKTERDYYNKRAILTNVTDDWLKYNQARNKYVNELRIAESNYYKNVIRDNIGNQKNMWKILKSLLGQKNKSQIKCIKIDDKMLSESSDIANALNSFFVTSIEQISQSIQPVDVNFEIATNELSSRFRFAQTNVNEITEAIKRINSKGDLEKITPKILLDAMPIVGDFLCDIINESFTNGTFPDWKCATITPAEKITGSLKPEDMRPINNLPAYEKVIEILAKDQLEIYLSENDILVENQSGFRKKHSCETALNLVLQNWKNEIDNKKFVICVFLDLKRAFETIDRSSLINTLHALGIRDNELKWFETYLSDRLQQTKIKNKMSSQISNDIGLAQGTVLAAILFVIYINDINNVVKNTDVLMKLFADDTLLYICTDNLENGIQQLNFVMKVMSNYLRLKKMKLNVNKTKAMIITSKRKNVNKENIFIEIDGEKIEFVNEIKYLGFIIDDKLNLDAHIDYICKKASKKAGVLRRISNKIEIEQRICIYKTILAPHFEYCASVIFFCNKGQIDRLQLIQNRAMRTIMKVNRYTEIKLMLETLGWLSVRQRIALLTLKLIHKMNLGQAPNYLNKMINKRGEKHKYKLRNNDKLAIQKCNKDSAQNSIICKGFQLYNNLPDEFKTETNVDKFKKMIIEWIKINIEI